MRWEICAREKKWDLALGVASVLLRAEPDHPLASVHRSLCFYDMDWLSAFRPR